LPPVDLSHCFTVTVPMCFTDVTPEMVIRVHDIIQIEKPAHVQYYLNFAADESDVQLREFFAIGLRSGIGIGDENIITDTEDTDAGAEPDPAASEDTAPRGGGESK
jgi:hypothetical protein